MTMAVFLYFIIHGHLALMNSVIDEYLYWNEDSGMPVAEAVTKPDSPEH